MATTELLLCCLEGTQNPALEIRAPAEQQLANYSVQHGFGVALLQIFLSRDVGMQTRQLAAVLTRRYIHNHWNRERPWFLQPEVLEEHKALMRAQLLQGLSVEDSKLCTAVCMAIASVARDDFPSKWPELLPHLLGMLQVGSEHPHQASAAMRCVVLVSEELQDLQIPQIVHSLFPALHQVFICGDQFSKGIRASACSVVYRAIKLASVSLLACDETSEMAASCMQLFQQSLPKWFEAFAQVIASPLEDESTAELSMRIEIVKIFSVIVETYPRLLSASLADVIHALWQGLSFAVKLYEDRLVTTDGIDSPVDRTDSARENENGTDVQLLDGDRISVDALAWEYMECVREVVASRHCRKQVRDELKPLAYTQIRFMQVTREQLEEWSRDVNAYIAHEDQGTFESSVRISAADVMTELCENFGSEGWRAALNAITEHLDESRRLRQHGGQERWWLRREACLFAMSVMCADCDVAQVSAIFRPDDFLQNVIMPDLAPETPPVLRGRALHCVVSFARFIPKELAQDCFVASVGALSAENALPVCMTAARAIGALTSDSSSVDKGVVRIFDEDFLRGSVSTVLERIAVLLSSATEDAALITIEAIHQTLKIPMEFTPEIAAQMPAVIEQILRALGRCAGDVMIVTEAVEAIETLVDKNEGAYVPLVANACAPLCVSVFSNLDQFVGTQSESVMELLSKIVRRPKGCSGLGEDNPLLRVVFPLLVTTMMTYGEEEVLQSGCVCLRAFLREAPAEVMGMEIGGKPVMECYVQTILRLLRLGSELSATAAISIITQLFLRRRANVQEVLPLLLGTVLLRLRVAQGLALRLAIVSLFARLIAEDTEASLGFLRQHTLTQPSQPALPLLLYTWSNIQSDFSTCYDLKVTIVALGALFCSGDEQALGVLAPCHIMMHEPLVDGNGVGQGMQSREGTVPYAFEVHCIFFILETLNRIESAEADSLQEESGEGEDEEEERGENAEFMVSPLPQDSPQAQDAMCEGAVGENGVSSGAGGGAMQAGHLYAGNMAGKFERDGPSDAARRLLVRSIMANIGKLREEETDRDRLQDPIAQLPLKQRCIEVLRSLAQHDGARFAKCLGQIPVSYVDFARSYLEAK